MNRCEICNKKIPSVFVSINLCKCGSLYCNYHKSDHDCSYDYKTEFRKTLEIQMPKIFVEKVIKM